MAKVSGHGGFWVRDDTVDVTIHNAEYELDVEETIDDTTDSNSGGAHEGLPIIYKVQSLSMSVAEDDTAYPEALGLTIGARVTLWLKKGAAATYDKVTNTIVRSVRKSNPQQAARRVSIMCEFGTYTENSGAPA